MRRFFITTLVILMLGLSCYPAHADNHCWNGADYSTPKAAGTNTGHEDSKVVWGTSGALGTDTGGVYFCQANVTNNSGATVWAMVFNAITLPANGSSPNEEWAVGASLNNGRFGYPEQPWTGVVIACSSTEGTLTVTTINACNFHVTVAK